MAAFKDNTGKEWTLELSFGDLLRVKAATGVDLLKIDQPRTGSDRPLMTDLELDTELMCTVVYHLLKPQYGMAGESEMPDMIALASRLGGDGLAAMHHAFWGALIDFFQKCGRAVPAAAIEKQMETLGLATEVALARVKRIDARQAVEKTLGKQRSESPAPSASTPEALAPAS